jgi:hypothetical protein
MSLLRIPTISHGLVLAIPVRARLLSGRAALRRKKKSTRAGRPLWVLSCREEKGSSDLS